MISSKDQSTPCNYYSLIYSPEKRILIILWIIGMEVRLMFLLIGADEDFH